MALPGGNTCTSIKRIVTSTILVKGYLLIVNIYVNTIYQVWLPLWGQDLYPEDYDIYTFGRGNPALHYKFSFYDE
jgi:hypothetical protein